MGAAEDLEAIITRDARFSPWTVAHHGQLLLTLGDGERTILLAPASIWDDERSALEPFLAPIADGTALLLLVGAPRDPGLAEAIAKGIGAVLPAAPRPDELFVAVANAFELLIAKNRAETRGKWLNRYRYELGELIEIARAITTEREIDKLLGLILEKSRFITGADAGSIYVVEGEDREFAKRSLRFKLTQNASISFDSSEFTMPLSARSVSAHTALTKKIVNIPDVYELGDDGPYRFDNRFDLKNGYRTKSMLCAPLVNHEGNVIGVLQLLNKREGDAVVPFDERSEELLSTLAAQAGISLENALLYAEIRALFEGFVKASVEAIEQRDPTTSGHSRRVADLTVGLAHALERETEGPYKQTTWTAQDVREMEYASLLHDFGKIGVREDVLVKAKKLYPGELTVMRQRFDFALRTYEAVMLREKLEALEQNKPRDVLDAIDRRFVEKRLLLEDAWAAVLSANEPTVLKAGEFARIEALARETFEDIAGSPVPLVTANEVLSLSVARGSLTALEIDQIRSHVTHTFSFLSRIPWGSALRRVPEIAAAHHEKLNGHGYPHGLKADQIPLQSKMMSVSDIFDALTANDRPYKKAIPIERALDILSFEVKDNHLDGELVRTFREAKVWTGVV